MDYNSVYIFLMSISDILSIYLVYLCLFGRSRDILVIGGLKLIRIILIIVIIVMIMIIVITVIIVNNRQKPNLTNDHDYRNRRLKPTKS